MRTSKITLGLFILITFMAISGFVKNVSAQKCSPVAYNIYFIDASSSPSTRVTAVHPGHLYTLVVLGTDVSLLEAKQSWYIASVSLLSASASEIRWNVVFSANQARTIDTVEMGIKCNRNPARWYAIDPKARLFNQ